MAVIRPFIIGFATTLKHLFKKPITVNYPEQKVPMFPKYRGKQVLMRDENGLEKCVACGLCSVACPADAIYLEAAENDGTVMAGPRYAQIYQIHKTRCIFCGMCEEACPVSAIFMGKDYELAGYSNKDFIWDTTDLLVPGQVWAAAPDASARKATFTAPSTSRGGSSRGIPRCRSGSASATSPTNEAPANRSARRSTGFTATTTTSTPSRPAICRTACITSPTAPSSRSPDLKVRPAPT